MSLLLFTNHYLVTTKSNNVFVSSMNFGTFGLYLMELVFSNLWNKGYIIIRLEHLLKVSPHDAEFVKKQLVRVKLSGDGTNIGKRLHIVTFTFTLLEEGNKAHSSDGNHILAVFK